jgi:hypothetical protein
VLHDVQTKHDEIFQHSAKAKLGKTDGRRSDHFERESIRLKGEE